MLDNMAKKQKGMGLIESLIALLVISIGLLGIAALQITSLKLNSSAQRHSQAVWFSYEMTDRIMANRIDFDSYAGIDTENSYDMDCKAAPCTGAQMVTADAKDWKEMLTRLPDGRGVISSPAANILVVSIMWDDDSDESNCINGEPDSDGKTCYSITTVNTP